MTTLSLRAQEMLFRASGAALPGDKVIVTVVRPCGCASFALTEGTRTFHVLTAAQSGLEAILDEMSAAGMNVPDLVTAEESIEAVIRTLIAAAPPGEIKPCEEEYPTALDAN